MVDAAQEISIRDAVEKDRAALIALTIELQAFECALEPNRSPPSEMAAPYLQEIWEWANARDGALLVAEAKGRGVVGYACVGMGGAGIDNLPEYERVGKLTDIVVAADWRGKGVGGALIRAAEKVLFDAGALRIEIAALSGNAAAQAVYQSRGYAPSYTVFARYLGGPLAPKAED
ncbi:MAG: GNAT family N-acetyltransferase [Neomegalonema sp.]|nr:GNAT family N-acetyltransferase [Neomegalonema sp.]